MRSFSNHTDTQLFCFKSMTVVGCIFFLISLRAPIQRSNIISNSNTNAELYKTMYFAKWYSPTPSPVYIGSAMSQYINKKVKYLLDTWPLWPPWNTKVTADGRPWQPYNIMMAIRHKIRLSFMNIQLWKYMWQIRADESTSIELRHPHSLWRILECAINGVYCWFAKMKRVSSPSAFFNLPFKPWKHEIRKYDLPISLSQISFSSQM